LGIYTVSINSCDFKPVRAVYKESNQSLIKGGEIETYTSHFVASQAISRILSIIFWIFTYAELN